MISGCEPYFGIVSVAAAGAGRGLGPRKVAELKAQDAASREEALLHQLWLPESNSFQAFSIGSEQCMVGSPKITVIDLNS